MSDVARRYARAAIDAAHDSGGGDAVQALAAGLKTFQAAYSASPELLQALSNPAFKAERAAVLEKVGAKLELGAIAVGLLRLLGENDRLAELSEIVTQVQELADEQALRLRAHVLSAIAITDAQKGRIAKALEKRLGRSVVVNVEVDPSIMGGLVVRVGDMTIDSSIGRQMELMAERLHDSH